MQKLLKYTWIKINKLYIKKVIDYNRSLFYYSEHDASLEAFFL